MSEMDRDLTAFDRVQWPARTHRLSMRPVTAEDFPRLYQIRATPGVSHWLTGVPASFDDYVER
jgi:hypothetical protein